MADEIVNKALEAIEIARKTGSIKKGTNEVTKNVERGVAKFVVYAGDVNPKEVIMHLPVICKEKNVPVIEVPSKEELGAAAGLDVGTSSVAIIKEGDSKSIIEDIKKKLK